MRNDTLFNEYLSLLGTSFDEFLLEPLLTRAALYKEYVATNNAQASSNSNDNKMPPPASPVSRDFVTTLPQPEKLLELSPSIQSEMSVHRIHRILNKGYSDIKRSIAQSYKHTRKRPGRDLLPQAVLTVEGGADLKPESMTWIKRLYGHLLASPADVAVEDAALPSDDDSAPSEAVTDVGSAAEPSDSEATAQPADSSELTESESDEEESDEEEDQAMSLEVLFATVLSPANMRSFNDRLISLHDDGKILPQSIRKGWVSVASAINKLSGKGFTKLPLELRTTAGEALNVCKDLMSSWNLDSQIAINKKESSRIKHAAGTPNAYAQLSSIYDLLVSERYRFLSTYRQQDSAVRNCGFILFCLCMARPTTRANVLYSLLTSEVANMSAGAELLIAFDRHKTHASYGSLVCLLPGWVTTLLSLYIKHVRPVLRQNHWGHGSNSRLFPQNSSALLEQFFRGTLGAVITQSQVRSLITEFIGEIHQGSPWYKFRDDLDMSAAHSSGGTIERNYQIKNKQNRETLLQQYLLCELLRPAENRAHLTLIQHATQTPRASPSSSSSSSSSSSGGYIANAQVHSYSFPSLPPHVRATLTPSPPLTPPAQPQQGLSRFGVPKPAATSSGYSSRDLLRLRDVDGDDEDDDVIDLLGEEEGEEAVPTRAPNNNPKRKRERERWT